MQQTLSGKLILVLFSAPAPGLQENIMAMKVIQFMRLIFTWHAKERMAKYGIIELQVGNCLKRPAKIFEGRGNRKIA